MILWANYLSLLDAIRIPHYRILAISDRNAAFMPQPNGPTLMSTTFARSMQMLHGNTIECVIAIQIIYKSLLNNF